MKQPTTEQLNDPAWWAINAKPPAPKWVNQLPPVGYECGFECSGKENKIFEEIGCRVVKIIAHDTCSEGTTPVAVFSWVDAKGKKRFNGVCKGWLRPIRAPKEPAPQEWVNGLPFVGCECKVLHNGLFIPATIIAHGEQHGESVAVCQTEFHALIRNATQCRPTRSPAERVKEETMAYARNVCPYPHSETTKVDVEALYDCGLLLALEAEI
jgi:hypothetical protein